MRLYLIRHGKTDAYLENKRQSPESTLGELGKDQANRLAARLKNVEFDVLISSHWPRAKQTAEIIAKEKENLELIIYPDLHEQDHSPLIYNAPDESDVVKEFVQERDKAVEKLDFDWKFKGTGESTNEILSRANLVKKSLTEKYKGKQVVAVTHGVFITAFLTSVILGDLPDKKSVIGFFHSFRHHNAGLTILDYDEETGYWKIASFNDHSHLL